MRNRRYSIDGEPWVSVSSAAKLLGKTAANVRKLIEAGELRSRPLRDGSATILVDLKQVADLRVAKEQWRREHAKARKAPVKPLPVADPMDRGTMSRFRSRLRNQLEFLAPAEDGGPPGRKGPADPEHVELGPRFSVFERLPEEIRAELPLRRSGRSFPRKEMPPNRYLRAFAPPVRDPSPSLSHSLQLKAPPSDNRKRCGRRANARRLNH